MSTTIEPSAQAQGITAPEQRIALRGVSWATYLKLSEEVGDGRVLMAYNRKVLELMSPGLRHERDKQRIDRLIFMVAEELGIPCESLGSTRWLGPDVERGVEPDDCYLLTAEKLAAPVSDPPDAATYPRPDLVVEVDMSRSEVDRPEIYASLGVREVWRFEDGALLIDRLGGDGVYTPASESLFLPVTPAEVVRWVCEPDSRDEGAWSRRVRAWVRAEVVPRRG